MSKDSPAVVQSDGTILLEVDSPAYEQARDSLMRFSDLVKSPEYIHTFRLSPLSLWNAASCALTPDDVIESLTHFSRYPVPSSIETFIRDTMAKFGVTRLLPRDGELVLVCHDKYVLEEIKRSDKCRPHIREILSEDSLLIDPMSRGALKEVLIKMGYPCEDLAGYTVGDPLDFGLNPATREGHPFHLRPYQLAARDAFWASGSARGGSGVVVLPCGAGKTMVGMGVMELASTETLILTTNVVALRQWISELLDKTDLPASSVKEYSGEVKEIGPVDRKSVV